MSSIFKRFTGPSANAYVFPDTADLPEPEEELPVSPEAGAALKEEKVSGGEQRVDPTEPVNYARVQAEAILAGARLEAEEIRAEAVLAAEQELEQLRRAAREDGYGRGFAEGMAGAMTEAKLQREQQAVALGNEVREFLEAAARERDLMLEQTREDLKNLALAIAEKVIRISLKSSGDIVVRMIEAATEKHRRCEWVQIYIADCTAKNLTCTVPELAAAISHLSERVRVIPMADDEPGTCIIEMPGEIIDVSVSTQLQNIRSVLSSVEPDRNDR